MFSLKDLLENGSKEKEEEFLSTCTNNRKKLYFIPQKEFSEEEISDEEVEIEPNLIEYHSPIPENVIVSQELDDITFSQLDNNFKPEENGNFVPTTFQQAVLDHMKHCRIKNKHKIGLLVIATGLGKTVIAILDIMNELENLGILKKRKKEISFKLLFLVHSKVIKDEAFSKFHQQFKKFKHFTFVNLDAQKSYSDEELKNSNFIFCLFQSIERIPSKILETVTHVVIDEVHHLLASTYTKAYNSFFKESIYILGITATLVHHDDPKGIKLKKKFKNVIYVNFPWMTAKKLGHFPNVEYLESIPLKFNDISIPTYSDLKKSFIEENKSVKYFIRDLDHSLERVKMNTEEQLKNLLTPQYIVNIFLEYQELRLRSNLKKKKKVIIVGILFY
jgi:superfamily II DNA or RNA helicase